MLTPAIDVENKKNHSDVNRHLTIMPFKPGATLNEEYHAIYVSNPISPERNFLCAILERAILDLQSDHWSRELFKKQAAQWFLDTSTEVPPDGFSFGQIEEYLDLNPDIVKRIRKQALDVIYGT